jgi:hypothetical protein
MKRRRKPTKGLKPQVKHNVYAIGFAIGLIAIVCFWANLATKKADEVDQLKVRIDQLEQTIEQSSTQSAKEQDGKSQEIQNLRKEVERLQKLTGLPEKLQVVREIAKVFEHDKLTAVAVAMAESGLNPRSQGWNCYYGNESMACKVADRHRAWSVDCGVFQINFHGQTCPEESFDYKWSIAKAKGMYDRRGWQPWVAHWKGVYLSKLADARSSLMELGVQP